MRKYGLVLTLLLVIVGLLLNIVTIFWMIPSYQHPDNMAYWYVSIVVLFFAVITGMLALLAED